jgi:hypothetical protein
MTFDVERVDYRGTTDLYDGFEPSDYTRSVVPGAAEPWQAISFEDLARTDLGELAIAVGEAGFAHIVSERGLRQVGARTWIGAAGLCMHYVRSAQYDGSPELLVLVAFGEWQPARYRVIVDSLWHLR